jgi:L-fuconolactonase
MTSFDRIDAHQHFWRRDRGDYTWLTPALSPIYRDYLPRDLAPKLDAAAVRGTVLVQAAATEAETHFMLALAGEAPFVRGVVGWVDFESPEAPAAIARLAQHPRLVGLRPMIQDIPDTGWMLRDSLRPAFEAMIRHDLVFDALVKPPHLPVLLELLRRYPARSVVVDHGAKPPIATGELDSWRRDLRAIARSTHAVCKLSGLVTEAGSAAPPVLAPCVEHLLATFGPERLLWGSDWPVCELVCPYEEWVAASDHLLASLSAAERALVYSETARKTYGL